MKLPLSLTILKRPNKEEIQLQKDKIDFTNKFRELMFEKGLYNNLGKTYKLYLKDKTDYGYDGEVGLNVGLSYDDLEAKKAYIQQYLQCMWIMKYETFDKNASLQIVNKPIDTSVKFVVPEVKAYQLYLGYDFKLNPIINENNVEDCMFLLAGATGSGKTRYMYQVLLCWILNCSVNEVELYLCDIAKDEYSLFQWCKHVKTYCKTVEQLYWMLKYLMIKLEKRKRILSIAREEGLSSSILEYNETHKSKLSFCYAFIDEYSVIVPMSTDCKEKKQMKEEIIDMLSVFSKEGRNVGIFVFTALQKTSKEEMGKSVIKNMAGVRISFRANDYASSEVVMGDGSAVGIPKRYAVYSQNGGTDKNFMFSPYIDIPMVKKMLELHIDKNHKKIDCEKEVKNAEPFKVEETKITKKVKVKINDSKHHPVINSLDNQTKDFNIPKNIISKGDGFNDY
jgi:hypothetical protein